MSCLDLFSRVFRSFTVPMRGILSFSIRHSGQGWRPRFLMQAIRHLWDSVIQLHGRQNDSKGYKYTLLWIVRGIRENSREYPAKDTVAAPNQDTVFVRVEEFIVKEKAPDCLHELPLQEAKHLLRSGDIVCRLICCLDGGGQLQFCQCAHMHRAGNATYRGDVSKMMSCESGRASADIFREVAEENIDGPQRCSAKTRQVRGV